MKDEVWDKAESRQRAIVKGPVCWPEFYVLSCREQRVISKETAVLFGTNYSGHMRLYDPHNHVSS